MTGGYFHFRSNFNTFWDFLDTLARHTEEL